MILVNETRIGARSARSGWREVRKWHAIRCLRGRIA